MKRQSDNPQKRPVVEWLFGIVSAVIVLGLIAFLLHEAIFADSLPPSLEASIVRIEPAENGTLVIVQVANSGDRAASAVKVRATLRSSDPASDAKEIEFDYIAAKAKRRGAFILAEQATGSADIQLEIDGFIEP